jgi:hypothetical protein
MGRRDGNSPFLWAACTLRTLQPDDRTIKPRRKLRRKCVRSGRGENGTVRTQKAPDPLEDLSPDQGPRSASSRAPWRGNLPPADVTIGGEFQKSRTLPENVWPGAEWRYFQCFANEMQLLNSGASRVAKKPFSDVFGRLILDKPPLMSAPIPMSPHLRPPRQRSRVRPCTPS